MNISFVTIGQSPRPDMVDEMVGIINRVHDNRTTISPLQFGALDNLDHAEIKNLWPKEQETVLVTRLASGKTVQVSENGLETYVQKAVDQAASQAGLVVLLCTGSFPSLRSAVPLIYPDRVFINYCFSVLTEGVIGVLVPDQSQIVQRLKLWKELGQAGGNKVKLVMQAASPYEGQGVVEEAAKQFADCDLIALDCMGYTLAAKMTAIKSGGPPVVLARSVVAMGVAELL